MGLQYDNFVFCLKTGNNKAVKFKKKQTKSALNLH